jgi:hypothetical protein
VVLLQYWLPAHLGLWIDARLRREPGVGLDCCERLGRGAGADALDHVEGGGFAVRWWYAAAAVALGILILTDLSHLPQLLGDRGYDAYNAVLIGMIGVGLACTLVLQWRLRAANRIARRADDLVMPARKLPRPWDFWLALVVAAALVAYGYAGAR